MRQLRLSFTSEMRVPAPPHVTTGYERVTGTTEEARMAALRLVQRQEPWETQLTLFLRGNRQKLTNFVQMLANGGYAKSADQQAAAWQLLGSIRDLNDVPFAEALCTLGLLESTKSYPRDIGTYHIPLHALRRLMQAREKELIPPIPPSPSQ
jgi:hypothetical protein